MTRILTFVIALAVAVAVPAQIAAQQVGDNVNVLPVYKTVTFENGEWVWRDDGLDYLRGNLYGQRLNEPAILVSSKNKDHIIMFFNDYRSVDVQEDQAIPGTLRGPFANLWYGVKGFLARLLGRPARTGHPEEADRAAFSQAAVGCSVSYDGGLTWTGCFVPGMPFDDTPASLAAPSTVRDLQGKSDPAAAAGAEGRGYLANIAYTYEQTSLLEVHALQDRNDSDVHHTWEWKNIVSVADCNNASWGCFVDKPAITTWPGATDKVYVTFTTFSGTTGTGNTRFQSKVNLAVSTDGGRIFSTQQVDGNYTQVQGTDVEVSRVATASDPAGTIFVVFRSFATPNSIILRRSTTKGSGWDKPVDILAAGDPARPALQTFDQPTIDLATGGSDGLAFRSNGFPAAAITPNGRLLIVTFQERANASGDPDPAGQPRIMMTYSTDGGRTWSKRKAISYESNRAEPKGLGFFSPGTMAPGPQVQPAAVCSTNSTCLVTWMESEEPLSTNGWMSGFARRMNHRAMALQIQNGVPVASSSFQVSRYSYHDETVPANDADGQVERNVAGFQMWNYWNFNNYDTGRSPFDGDYTDVRALTENTFITAFTDNRFVVPATQGSGGTSAPWENFKNYGPWPQCNNPGSRAQTVMAAPISNGLVVTAPTNHKSYVESQATFTCGGTFDPQTGTFSPPTRNCIEFPFTVWNNTGDLKRFRIWLGEESNASFAKDINVGPAYPLKNGGLNIYQYSSNAANVYAFDGNPVTVKIAECPPSGCANWTPDRTDASITFNSSLSTPASGSQGTYAYSPSYVAVVGRNVVGRNVVGRNVVGRNVVGRNVVGRNMLPPDVTVYDVIDYSIEVTPSSADDVGSYLSLFNVDEAYAQDYAFQVLVTKPLTSFTTVDCEPFNLTDGALIGETGPLNVVGRNVVGRNVVGRNVVGRNPVPIDGDLEAQTIQNTSFTMGSSTEAYLASGNGTGAQTNFGCPGGWGRIGECTLAAPRLPNLVTITLRAYQISPHPTRVYDPEVAPPAVAVAEYACKEAACFAASGPDLVVPATAGVTPTPLDAGSLVTFPTATIAVENTGKDCADGQPCGTARENRWGIYLSTAANVADIPRYAADDTCPYADSTRCVPGMIKENLTDFTKPITTLLTFSDGQPATDDLPDLVANTAATHCGTPDSCADVTPHQVRIPAGIPLLNSDHTGTYYAWLYIDDERVVSELNEDNNYVRGGPITVRPGAYETAGLLSPCGPGLTCSRTGLGAVPIAWQFTQGGVALDTLALRPTLTFYRSTSTWEQGSQIGSAVMPCAAGTQCDLSTGNSGFQYCNAAGTYNLCGTRSTFTWQYNWERKDPSGQDLTGNLILWIYPTATQNCQDGASCAPGTKAIGPIQITLR